MTNHLINSWCVKKAPENYPGLFFISVLSLLLFFSCTTIPQKVGQEKHLYQEESLTPSAIRWSSVCKGLERTDFSNPQIPVIWHAVRIHLETTGIKICAWPETAAQRKAISLRTFAEQTGADIAFNAIPYSQTGFLHTTPVGICIVDGNLLSPAVKRYGALLLNKSEAGGYQAAVIDSQTELCREAKPDYAFGGFWTILRDGTVNTFLLNRDSRTAAGISASGKILYILVVEGEKKQQSSGLSFMECARILNKMGSAAAIAFDGGYSSNMYIQGKRILSYHNNRHNASYIGFKFTPQPQKTTLTNTKE